MTVHLLFVAFVTFYKIYILIGLSSTMRLIELVNLSAQYSVPIYTYWFIFLDTLLYCDEHRTFWKLVELIDRRYWQQTICLRGYIWKFASYISVALVLFLSLLAFREFAHMLPTLAYLTLISACQIRLFHYLFHLEVIKFQLETIVNQINTTIVTSKISSHFKGIRDGIATALELTELLNVMFGWSQVFALLFCFYNFVTCFNSFYAHHHEENITNLYRKYQLFLAM